MRVIALAVSLLFLSCGPNHLDDRRYEQVIIDPYDTSIYFYSDNETPELGWIERKNIKGGEYYFTVYLTTVTLRGSREMKEVRLHPKTTTPGYINLDIVNNRVVRDSVTPYQVFVIYYEEWNQ